MNVNKLRKVILDTRCLSDVGSGANITIPFARHTPEYTTLNQMICHNDKVTFRAPYRVLHRVHASVA